MVLPERRKWWSPPHVELSVRADHELVDEAPRRDAPPRPHPRLTTRSGARRGNERRSATEQVDAREQFAPLAIAVRVRWLFDEMPSSGQVGAQRVHDRRQVEIVLVIVVDPSLTPVAERQRLP